MVIQFETEITLQLTALVAAASGFGLDRNTVSTPKVLLSTSQRHI
ncbi:MAG TPA: hypothetical protein VD735_03175 [Candidatus Saccharimonadales bacterium]|nr:hypothetical protein [Candidatus Saccharimonadales bacterium]